MRTFPAWWPPLIPWLGRIVIVGGWAYRLYRLHPVAQQLEYPPVVTLDADVALPSRLPAGNPDLRQRLLSHGFQEELLGHHQPPVTHYHLGLGAGGFYVEFLTPLIGSGYKRNRKPNSTMRVAGVVSQNLRHLDLLLHSPWSIDDVLFTIEYTALDSFDYRQQILRGQDRQFTGDQVFSVRDQFPDAWFDLNNPETVADPASQMRATLTLQSGDFAPHIENLAAQDVSLFCLRQDGFEQELVITALSYTPPGGSTVSAAQASTTEGIIGTRRASGAAWQVLVGKNPVGDWSIQFPNTDVVRSWFKNGQILDLVLVMTVNGLTPEWS